jgi:hypothetical protein
VVPFAKTLLKIVVVSNLEKPLLMHLKMNGSVNVVCMFLKIKRGVDAHNPKWNWRCVLKIRMTLIHVVSFPLPLQGRKEKDVYVPRVTAIHRQTRPPLKTKSCVNLSNAIQMEEQKSILLLKSWMAVGNVVVARAGLAFSVTSLWVKR